MHTAINILQPTVQWDPITILVSNTGTEGVQDTNKNAFQ